MEFEPEDKVVLVRMFDDNDIEELLERMNTKFADWIRTKKVLTISTANYSARYPIHIKGEATPFRADEFVPAIINVTNWREAMSK